MGGEEWEERKGTKWGKGRRRSVDWNYKGKGEEEECGLEL